MPPGAYVVSRFGVLDTDGELIWPRVVLCVPRSSGAVVHVGRIRLVGERHVEEQTLSTGRRIVSRSVRYRIMVIDESEAGQVRGLARHVPGMPIGQALQDRWRADAAGLARELCGDRPR